jgi:hypothetical protein
VSQKICVIERGSHITSRSCILGVALLCGARSSLPSVDSVEHSFRREHQAFEILRVTSRVDVSDEAHRHLGNAIFEVIYREPGGSTVFRYERKFGTVAEGWVEGPSSTTEVPQ